MNIYLVHNVRVLKDISSFIINIPCKYKWVSIEGNKITQIWDISKFKR